MYSIEILVGAHTSTMPTSVKRQEKRMIRDDAEWIVCLRCSESMLCGGIPFVADSAISLFHHF